MMKQRGSKMRWSLLGGLLALALVAPPVAALTGADLLAALIAFFKLYLQFQMENNTADIVDSNHRAADKVNQVRIRIFDQEVKMNMEPPPEICLALEIMEQAKKADFNIKDVIRKLEGPVLQSIIGSENPFRHLQERIRRHNATYCNPIDVVLGRCDAASNMANADLSASILLMAQGYSEPERQAAEAYAANLINPEVPLLPDTDLENTPQWQQYQAALMALAARKSLAMHSLGEVIGDRTRVNGLGQAMTKSEASPQELMLYEVERRYGDSKWIDEVLNATPGAVERERLVMDAWRMQMEVRRYRQQQRIEVLLATLVAMQSEQASRELLNQLREATQRAVK